MLALSRSSRRTSKKKHILFTLQMRFDIGMENVKETMSAIIWLSAKPAENIMQTYDDVVLFKA